MEESGKSEFSFADFLARYSSDPSLQAEFVSQLKSYKSTILALRALNLEEDAPSEPTVSATEYLATQPSTQSLIRNDLRIIKEQQTLLALYMSHVASRISESLDVPIFSFPEFLDIEKLREFIERESTSDESD